MTDKKEQYWNHFNKTILPKSLTSRRLEKAKAGLWNDKYFWLDILFRHGGDSMTPEEMNQNDKHNYEHCMSNMTGMVFGWLIEQGLIK